MRVRITGGIIAALCAMPLVALPATAEGVEPVPPGVECAGDPPRQTADPLSPPCVPFFEGDNGCDTYGVGVTCDEVRIAIVLDGGINYSTGSGLPASDRNVAPSGRRIYDLWKTPEENNRANNDPVTRQEHLTTEGLRVWQDYFNQRFQIYGRQAHFFVYYADAADGTPVHRRENAADIRAKINPFAVVSLISEGAERDLVVALARKGVLNFGSLGMLQASAFSAYPKLIWGFEPTVERAVGNYGAYVCTSVVGRSPVLAGPAVQARNAQPPALGGNDGVRVLGLLSTSDERFSALQAAGDMVEDVVEGCGGSIAARREFPTCCLAQDNGENPAYALAQMAEFQAAGVTTILWAGGLNGNYGKAAAALGYAPEWILLGDGQLDANAPVVLSQNTAAFDGRAITVTPQVVEGALSTQRCFGFYREINTTTPDGDLGYTCDFYRPLHLLFTAIQVSGPYLGPTNIDTGLHAIPARPSAGPDSPACYFPAGEYACVQDAQAEYWSAAGTAPGATTPGCWRPIEGGARHSASFSPWPAGNVNASITGAEGCNGYSASSRFNLT